MFGHKFSGKIDRTGEKNHYIHYIIFINSEKLGWRIRKHKDKINVALRLILSHTSC